MQTSFYLIRPSSFIFLIILCIPFWICSPHCKHATCGKCPLYADTSASDAMRIANAAKEAAQSVLQTEAVKVDVQSLLKGPPPLHPHRGRK